MELMVRIVGENLAEVDFRWHGNVGKKGRSHFFLGIQKGQEVIDRVGADDGESATFTALFTVSPLPDGATNFLGPFAQGTRTARFCYLCWLEQEDGQLPHQFARIKLPLSPLRWERVEAAAQAGTPVVVRFSLVGKGGGPVCASIPNESIHWEG